MSCTASMLGRWISCSARHHRIRPRYPNANTLIVDRADAFGLASSTNCAGGSGGALPAPMPTSFGTVNLPRPRRSGASRDHRREFAIGAGYSIAMRDLEMRGAESCWVAAIRLIASVGFHLYTRLLAAAVKQIRSTSGVEAGKLNLHPSDLGTIQSIVHRQCGPAIGDRHPADYIPDTNLRLRSTVVWQT